MRRRALAILSECEENTAKGKESKRRQPNEVQKKKARKPRTTVRNSRIYENILKSEAKFRVVKEPKHIVQYEMRSIVIDWLHEVASEYRFQWETLLLSVSIFDRYIHLHAVSVEKMQLIGVTSMFLASKYEEIHPPRIHDFAYMCDSAYTTEDIVIAENEIMSALDWSICCPTVGRFLEYYTTLYQFTPMTNHMARVFIDAVLQERAFLSFSACKIAGAALRLSCFYAENLDTCTNIDALNVDEHLSGDMIHICYILNAAYRKITSRRSLKHALTKHDRTALRPLPFKEFKHNSVEAAC